MQFTTFAIALFAASAAALSVPRQADSITTGEAAARCGNGQVLSCCGNKGTGSSDGSLLGSLAQGLIGGNCDMVPINIIGANGILMNACQSNNAACCTGDEDGLANIPCNPING